MTREDPGGLKKSFPESVKKRVCFAVALMQNLSGCFRWKRQTVQTRMRPSFISLRTSEDEAISFFLHPSAALNPSSHLLLTASCGTPLRAYVRRPDLLMLPNLGYFSRHGPGSGGQRANKNGKTKATKGVEMTSSFESVRVAPRVWYLTCLA